MASPAGWTARAADPGGLRQPDRSALAHRACTGNTAGDVSAIHTIAATYFHAIAGAANRNAPSAFAHGRSSHTHRLPNIVPHLPARRDHPGAIPRPCC
ncbi:MAG: hypothetical protein KIS63_00625 [Caldilineales bacterium]|nr:hypothetical protein [Caldilineales bacterium]